MPHLKPVIIFIPGAWHTPECFAPTTKLVSGAGYPVVLVYSALLNPPPNKVPKGYLLDVERIQAHMRDAISNRRKVVLFAHSLGELAASAAIEGFEEHIIHLILCAAWIIPKRMALSVLGTLPSWVQLNEEKTLMLPTDPQSRFYHDVLKEEVDKAVASIKPYSNLSMDVVTPFEGYRAVPTTYTICTQDRAVPLEAQELKVREFAKDSRINVVNLDASHSPFLSMPSKVAEIITGVC